MAAALSELVADEQNSELRGLLGEIAEAEFDGDREPLLEAVAQQARTADPLTMPEETKAAFRALYRLMSAPLHAVDPEDAEAVRIAFGMPTMLGAAGALLAPGDEPPPTIPPVPAEPAITEPPTVAYRNPLILAEPGVAEPPSVPGEPAITEPPTVPAEPADTAEPGVAEPPSVPAEPAITGLPTVLASVVAEPPSAARRDATPGSVAGPAAARAETRPKLEETARPRPAEPEPGSGPPDPRIADAGKHGRSGLAYWYSVALKLPVAVQTAFEVLALSEAITVDGDDCSVRIRELLRDFDVTSVAQHPDYLEVLAAGSARALLRMPFSPCAAAVQDAVTLIADDGASVFLAAVLHAAAFGLEVGKLREEHGRSPAEFFARRDSALSGLLSAMETAKLQRTRYARATFVWRRFVSERGPLGGPVCAILARPEVLEPAEDVLALLRDQKAVDKLIDETDLQLNPVTARRSKIVSGARDDLREHTNDLLDALRSYVEAARAAASRQHAGTSDQLGEAAESLTRAVGGTVDDDTDGVGSLAISQVKRWLRDALVQHVSLPDAQLPVLERALSRSFEVQRLDDGTIVPDSVGTSERPTRLRIGQRGMPMRGLSPMTTTSARSSWSMRCERKGKVNLPRN